MAYIGNIPAESFASFETETFTVSATTNYTLSHAVTNENEIRLVINGVVQQPGSGKAYTASGTTLTLSSATASGDVMYAVYLGRALQTVNPPAASVGNSQTAPTIITGQTAETSIATDDTILIHDTSASALRKITRANFVSGIGGANTPYFFATMSGNQSLGDATNTKIAFDVADIDSNSAFDTTNKRFVVPSGQAGKYYIYAQVNSDSGDVLYVETTIAKNGSEKVYIINNPDGSHSNLQTNIAGIIDLSASDYIELFVASNQTSGNATISTSVRGKNTLMLGYKLID